MYVGKREKFYQITKRSSNLGESECKSIFIYAEKDKMSDFNDCFVFNKKFCYMIIKIYAHNKQDEIIMY